MKFFRKLISPKTVVALVLALVVGQFISPDVAFALSDGNDNETLKAFAQLFSIFVNIFTFLSLVFLNYGGDLVGTEFLTAPQPMAAIRPMWVIIRNLTNILFVLVLLFLAFSNLFSSFGENSNWTIKDKLPKVILALIAINFSLLGFKVILDAVHVGTITIFAIPDSTLNDKNKENLAAMLEANVAVTEDGTVSYIPFYEAINNLMCGKKTDWDDENGGVKDSLPEDCLFAVDPSEVRGMQSKSKAAQNLFLAFGIQFQKLQNLPTFAARLNDWSDVFTSVLFVSILSLAQVVALAAVFIALIIRVVVLWIAMVFSPILIAASIMGFGQGEGGEISKMITTSIVMPLKIAAAFAVSFLMMDAMMEMGGPSGDFIKTGASVSVFGATGYGLLWSIATIVVFWKAAFWALKGGVGDDFIQQIRGGAEKAGAFVARAGTVDREFFPMPGMDSKNKVAFSSIWKAGTSGIKTAHERAMESDARSLTDHLGLTDKDKTGNVNALTTAINGKRVGSMIAKDFVNFVKEHPLDGATKTNIPDLYAKLAPELQQKLEARGGKERFISEMSKELPAQKDYLLSIKDIINMSESDIRALTGKGITATTGGTIKNEAYVQIDVSAGNMKIGGDGSNPLGASDYNTIMTELRKEETKKELTESDYIQLVKLFEKWGKKYVNEKGEEIKYSSKDEQLTVGIAALKKSLVKAPEEPQTE